MKKLRKIIEREGEESSKHKTIPGGIRDIEFVVQALQLLNGGKDDSIKTGNTLSALQKLNRAQTSHEKSKLIIYRMHTFFTEGLSTFFN